MAGHRTHCNPSLDEKARYPGENSLFLPYSSGSYPFSKRTPLCVAANYIVLKATLAIAKEKQTVLFLSSSELSSAFYLLCSSFIFQSYE